MGEAALVRLHPKRERGDRRRQRGEGAPRLHLEEGARERRWGQQMAPPPGRAASSEWRLRRTWPVFDPLRPWRVMPVPLRCRTPQRGPGAAEPCYLPQDYPERGFTFPEARPRCCCGT